MTKPEVKLWAILRTRPGGFRFRRQHPIGLFVLDFYCPEARLAIEVDGIAHDLGRNPERDVARDAWLAEQGIETLRLPAAYVTRHLEDAVAAILDRCARPLPLHHPADGPPPHAAHGEDE